MLKLPRMKTTKRIRGSLRNQTQVQEDDTLVIPLFLSVPQNERESHGKSDVGAESYTTQREAEALRGEEVRETVNG
jgi:hypothetical protein